MIRCGGIKVPPQSQKPFAIRVKKVTLKEMLARLMLAAVRESCLPEIGQVSLVSSLGEERA